MQDKIIVTPESIRGLGNIISEKELSDFDLKDCVLSSASDSVNGVTMTVYTNSFLAGGALSVTSGEFVLYTSDLSEIPLVVHLVDENDTAISGASVRLLYNSTVYTGTTNNNGDVEFSISFVDGESYYPVKFSYAGDSTICGGCVLYGVIVVGTYDFKLTGDETIIQTGDTCNLSSTLGAFDLDGKVVTPETDTPIYFFKYTPLLFSYDGVGGTEIDKFIRQTHAILTTDSTGTTLTSDGDWAFIWANLNGTGLDWNKGDYSGDLTVELDVVSTDGNATVSCYQNPAYGTIYRNFTLAVGHNKVVKSGTTYTHYVDDVQQSTGTTNLIEPFRIGLITSNGTSVCFKNFSITQEDCFSLTCSDYDVYIGDSVVLKAQINQKECPEGLSVSFYEDDTLLDTVVTDFTGLAKYTFTGGIGTHNLKAVCDGVDSNTVTVNVSLSSFNLTIDKSVLSYRDGDSCTLSATALGNNDVGVSGLQVDFLISGNHIFKYTGTGGTEVDSWIVQTGGTKTVSSTGTTFNGDTGTCFAWANLTGTDTHSGHGDYIGDLTVDFDVVSTSNSDKITFYEYYHTGAVQQAFTVRVGHNQIVKTGNVFNHYVDDVLVSTATKVLEEPLRIGFIVNEGNSVQIKDFNIDGTGVLSTVTTGSDGYATQSYTSRGAGDLSFSAKCGSFYSDTYNVVDATYYNPNTITSQIPVDITLPSEFSINYKWTMKATSSASGVLIGTNGSRNAIIGQFSNRTYGIRFLNPTNQVQLASSTINSEVDFTVTYENGTYTMTNGTNTVTTSNFQFTCISLINGTGNCPISEVIIKPI